MPTKPPTEITLTTQQPVMVRDASPIRTRYSIRALLSEIAEPMALIQKVNPAHDKWSYGARRIELARKIEPMISDTGVLWEAGNKIVSALRAPLDQATAEMLLAMLLDGISKRAGDNAETKIEAMLGVVTDIGDPIADVFIEVREPGQSEEPFRPEHPISPTVLAIAVKQLIAQNIFDPQPAELRKACIKAYIKVRGQAFQIEYFRRARHEIENEFRRHGTDAEKARFAEDDDEVYDDD